MRDNGDFIAYPGCEGLPRILSLAKARTLGFSRKAIEHRLRTGRWQLVLPHTYLTGNTLTWPDRLNAALSFAGEDSLLTSAAALADLGLRTVERPANVLVLVPFTNRVRPTQWVRIRRTRRMPRQADLPGPRRAELARCVADLALERKRVDDVRALVTQAVRGDLCTLEQLAVELAAGPHKHSKNLRLALAEAGLGAWSAPEAQAARVMTDARLPAFEQNARIDLPDGTYVFVDFLWRSLKAVLEIDSIEHHYLSPAQREATDARHMKLMTAGYATTHRTPWAVHNRPAEFVLGIERWLAARARELAA